MDSSPAPIAERIRDLYERYEADHGRAPTVLRLPRRDSLALRAELRRSPSYDAWLHCFPATLIDPMQDADGRTFAGMRVDVEGEEMEVGDAE